MKKYSLILADPPWQQGKGGKKSIRPNSSGGKLEYPTMPFEAVRGLLSETYNKYAENDCNIFVWTIDKYLTETDLMLVDFGFKRHARITWDKVTGIPAAFTVRYSSEYLLWYYKGKHQKIAKEWQGKYTTVFREKVTKHSRKPECSYEFLDNIYPNVTRLELFARPYTELIQKRDGWDVWGNEVTSDIDLVPKHV